MLRKDYRVLWPLKQEKKTTSLKAYCLSDGQQHNVQDFDINIAINNWRTRRSGSPNTTFNVFDKELREACGSSVRIKTKTRFALWIYLSLYLGFLGVKEGAYIGRITPDQEIMRRTRDVLGDLSCRLNVSFNDEMRQFSEQILSRALSVLPACWMTQIDNYLGNNLFSWDGFGKRGLYKAIDDPDFERILIFSQDKPQRFKLNPFMVMLYEKRLRQLLKDNDGLTLRDFQQRAHCSGDIKKGVIDLAIREGWIDEITLNSGWLIRDCRRDLTRSADYVANLIEVSSQGMHPPLGVTPNARCPLCGADAGVYDWSRGGRNKVPARDVCYTVTCTKCGNFNIGPASTWRRLHRMDAKDKARLSRRIHLGWERSRRSPYVLINSRNKIAITIRKDQED